MEKKKILFIDDEKSEIKKVEKIIDEYGENSDLVVINNAVCAFDHLDSSCEVLPDLIILDINMPLMNGVDFLKSIRTNKKLNHIPVVILSESKQEEYDHTEVMELSLACNCINKPLDFYDYKQKMFEVLDHWLKVF